MQWHALCNYYVRPHVFISMFLVTRAHTIHESGRKKKKKLCCTVGSSTCTCAPCPGCLGLLDTSIPAHAHVHPVLAVLARLTHPRMHGVLVDFSLTEGLVRYFIGHFFLNFNLAYNFRFSGDEKHRNKNVWPYLQQANRPSLRSYLCTKTKQQETDIQVQRNIQVNVVLKRSHRILVSSLARNSARLCGQLVCTNEHRTPYTWQYNHVDRGVIKYFTTPWSIESPVPRKVKITRSYSDCMPARHLSCFSCRCSFGGLY